MRIESINILLALSVLIFFSCAPTSIQGLREDNKGHYTFIVQDRFETVFQRIYENAKKTFADDVARSFSQNVVGYISKEGSKGNITIYSRHVISPRISMTIDVVEETKNATKVTSYYYFETWEKHTKKVEAWAKNTKE